MGKCFHTENRCIFGHGRDGVSLRPTGNRNYAVKKVMQSVWQPAVYGRIDWFW